MSKDKTYEVTIGEVLEAKITIMADKLGISRGEVISRALRLMEVVVNSDEVFVMRGGKQQKVLVK